MLAKMAYRAEPEGVLAVVEAPRPRASARRHALPRRGRDREARQPRRDGALGRGGRRRRARRRRGAGRRLEPERDPRLDRRRVHAARRRGDARRRARRSASASSRRSSVRRRAYTDADLTAPTALVVGAEDEGLDERWRAAADLAVAIPRPRPHHRQPQRRDRRRDPALRGGAPAWLTATTSSAPARRSATASPRTPMLELAHARRAPQVRALPAHGLVQGARRAEQAQHARPPEERRRGVIAISAGNHAQAVAYAAAEEGVDALRRDVAGRLRAEDRGDARLRRRRRPRGDRPGRGVRAARAADGRDRTHARAPARRSGGARRRRHGRARDRGGRT